MDKEGEIPQMTFDLWHEPLERADAREEEEDPLEEEDAWEDHQAHQEVDHQGDHPEEITTIGTGMTSKGTMKAAISLEK